MKRRVVVTGLGTVTSLSLKVDGLWQKILAGEFQPGQTISVDVQEGAFTFG